MAGLVGNINIAKYCDICIAFPGPKSIGTYDMIKKCKN